MAGFAFFVPGVVFYLAKDKASLAIRILLLCVAVFAVLAHQRNAVWLNEFTLWDDAVRKAPNNQMGYLNRGAYYHVHGDLDRAKLKLMGKD